MNKRAAILSIITSSITAVFFTATSAFAQGGDLPEAGSRLTGYTCEINGAISLASDAKKPDGQTLFGRGMATCRNDQGFSTDYPIVMSVTADTSLKDFMTSSGVRVVTESFVVNRDPSEMFDKYQNYQMLNPKGKVDLARSVQSVTVSRGIGSSRSIILHGRKHKLFMNLTLLGDSEALQSLKIHEFSLSYDTQAPDLSGTP